MNLSGYDEKNLIELETEGIRISKHGPDSPNGVDFKIRNSSGVIEAHDMKLPGRFTVIPYLSIDHLTFQTPICPPKDT